MHTRAFVVGNAFHFGMEREGWDLLRSMHDAIRSANGLDPWDQSLYYDPFTARLDWGVFYMTAPASWLAYQALAGYDYDANHKRLRLDPPIAKLFAKSIVPVFTPNFWGLMTCGTDRPDQLELDIVRLVDEALEIREIVVQPTAQQAAVRLDDSPVSCALQRDTIHLTHPVSLREGQKLSIQLRR